MYKWAKHGGYEVTTKGDKRFSALVARMPDGRTIEQHYQCDVKGYDPGGTNWRLGKGKPPIRENIDLWQEYLSLWKQWASFHSELISELAQLAYVHDMILSDRFATSEVNQARALVEILNEKIGFGDVL